MSDEIVKSRSQKQTTWSRRQMAEAKSAEAEGVKNVQPASSNSTADFGKLVAGHRAYFQSGATRSLEWRESQLIALRSMMKDHAEDFYAALWSDLKPLN